MISGENRKHAQEMRRFATPAERALWQGLRRRTLGVYFRRQFPLGPYIVDFYCNEARLVIEVDGETHVTPGVDWRRDHWLAKRGLTVLHFWNNEVLENLEVLHVIATKLNPVAGAGFTLGGAPSPVPSRSGRGEVEAQPPPQSPPPHAGEGVSRSPSPLPKREVRRRGAAPSPLPEREGTGEGAGVRDHGATA